MLSSEERALYTILKQINRPPFKDTTIYMTYENIQLFLDNISPRDVNEIVEMVENVNEKDVVMVSLIFGYNGKSTIYVEQLYAKDNVEGESSVYNHEMNRAYIIESLSERKFIQTLIKEKIHEYDEVFYVL